MAYIHLMEAPFDNASTPGGSAVRCWDPDRAAPVGGMRHRQNARGNRCHRAAGGHETGLLAARHIGGVVIGDKILEQAAAEGRRLTGLEKAEVLVR